MIPKSMLLKIFMVCDLTDVPMSGVPEEIEVQAMRIKSRLNAIIDRQHPHRPLQSAYKYDRIIGFNSEGFLRMYPMTASEALSKTTGKYVLLSELREDAEVFYACSAPVVQTGEKNVRAIFVQSIAVHQVDVTSEFDLAVNEEYIFDNRRVRCKYGKSYYGAMSHAYVLSIFYDSNNCKAWDKYAEQVLTGEWKLRDGVAALFVGGVPGTEEMNKTKDMSAREGRTVNAGYTDPDTKAKDFWECIDKIH